MTDGRIYYVGVPETLRYYDRNPLIISTSNDGKLFTTNTSSPMSYINFKKMCFEKVGNTDSRIPEHGDVTISRRKEPIEVIRFKLEQLNKTGHQDQYYQNS